MSTGNEELTHDGADRVIAGEGTTEQAWRAWPGLAALAGIAATELVPPGRRAVILAPHPDDELLGTGGLIGSLLSLPAAEAAADVLVVAVTDGTGSHPDSPLWPAGRLAQVRPAETRDALRILRDGVAPCRADETPGRALRVVRAGLPDGGVAAHEEALCHFLRGQLRADDVLFATWRFDGHPDHEAVGRAGARAAAESGATLIEVPVWAWHWATPGDPRLPWDRARRLLLSSSVTQAKRRAVQAYPSQLVKDASTGAPPILPPHVLARVLREFEVFFV
ncbi:PIG-L family deacetylase [Robbsia sp. Bb-Pol-6]|uniref:PIG-L family deacetylase n=1 Tax=Robbsia betulipollinis TaxID=2981849 RepID=A0ABT3ZR75_9BURK|nr:PIG-L family deacetylase [Robbsia betulipollinis]MCY0389059.1 PIG-L family deacetylase [Robbsia betulipollinis]